MKKMNKKGFTLIELLAVIVIMGILLIVAIPMVTKYIEDSRKDTFVTAAKSYISSARYAYLNGDYAKCAPGTNGTVYVPIGLVKIDNSGGKSSFGAEYDTAKGYVEIEGKDDGSAIYAIVLVDKSGNGVRARTTESNLKRGSISRTASGTVPTIPTTTGTITCAVATTP